MPNPHEQSTDLTSVVWDALSKRVRRLSADLAIPTSVGDDLTASLQPIATASDPIAVARELIQERTRGARELLQLLEGLAAEVDVQEKRRAWLARFTDEWWRPRRAAARDANNVTAARQAWLQAFADALLAGEYEACLRWTELELPSFVAARLPIGRCRFAARALAAGRFVAALPTLEELASASAIADLLEVTARGELLAFAARIHLFDLDAPGDALRRLVEAAELAPHSHAVNAARSDYHAKLEQPDFAAEYARTAIECDPDAPEGFVALGAWAEGQQRWTEAQEHYDHAAKLVREHREPWRGLCRLRTKVSGLLALRLARTLSQAQRPPAALEAVNQALALGVRDEAQYPEVEAYELKAELLEKLQRPAGEIAEALFQAGRCRYWRRESSGAVSLFRRAMELDPNLAGPRWFLADALLVLSHTEQLPDAKSALVAEAIREWDQAAEHHALAPGFSWPYVTRALLCEQQALLPDQNPVELWWQAVSCLECAVLLDPSDSQHWAYLGYYFGLLFLEANALEATAKALELAPDNAQALNQRATILADTGRFAEAEAVIDRRLKSEPEAVWERAVKAFILLYLHRYDEALAIINAVIEEAPDVAWHRDVRALCWRGAGREDKAQEDYAWLVEKWRSTGQLPDLAFGWATLNAGQPRTAFEIFDRLCREPATLTSSALSFRGLAELALGELDRAQADLADGAARAINLRETQLMLETGLPWAEKQSANWPHGEPARQIIEATKGRLAARQSALTASPRTSEMELVDTPLAAATGQGANPTWTWLGTHAVLARLHATRGNWRESARAYVRLEACGRHFPEAPRGFSVAFGKLLEAGDESWRRKEPDEAEARWRDAVSLVPVETASYEGLRADAGCRLGQARLAQHDVTVARVIFLETLDQLRDAGEADAGGALARRCLLLLQSPRDYWALLDAWRTWAADAQTAPAAKEDLTQAVETLAPFLESTYQLKPASTLLPVVTPIAVEIGADLIPLAAQENAPLMQRLIPEMRERLRESMGWRFPGVRFRGNADDLLPESYVLLLDEVPIVQGTLPRGMRFSPATLAEVAAAGVPSTGLSEAAHPGDPTGARKGCWIAENFVALLEAKGISVWHRREEYLVRHLESLLRQSAAPFVGVQEVSNQLDEWHKDGRAVVLTSAILADRNAVICLRTLLRALLAELVPVVRWPVILEVINQAERAPRDILPLLCEARRRLRDQLPGNESDALRVPLAAAQEQALSAWLRNESGRWFFAIPPTETQEFLAHVRQLTAQHGPRFALVVRNAELRLFIRRMVQLEFVGVMVLAEQELAQMGTRATSATVEEPPGSMSYAGQNPVAAATSAVRLNSL